MLGISVHIQLQFSAKALLLALLCQPLASAAQETQLAQGIPAVDGRQRAAAAADILTLAREQILDWPSMSQAIANQMLEKYGAPSGVTPSMLIWENTPPFIRTIVHKQEVPHDFPVPHSDFLEQSIEYVVPADKIADLIAYNGSLLVERTNRQLSVRCASPAANFLSLNIAHELAIGERSVDQSKIFHAQTYSNFLRGEETGYVTALRFSSDPTSRSADQHVSIEIALGAVNSEEEGFGW